MDLEFLTPAAITVGFAFVASLFHYYRYFKRDVAFAIVVYSLLVFCIVYFVSFENNLGLGIGLLGILSLIRLRSTPENLIDIGFAFYSITIGLLNASILNVRTVLLVNVVLLIVLVLFASKAIYRQNAIKTVVTFDDLESEKLHDQTALMRRIQKKFGVTPIKFKVRDVNYLKDSITVEITYNGSNSL